MNRQNMPTTFPAIVEAMHGKDHVTLCNNTVAYLTEDLGFPVVIIALHGHAIVRIYQGGTVQVRHCGYPTVTTFDRIKRFLPEGFTATRQGGDPRLLFRGTRFDDIPANDWSCAMTTTNLYRHQFVLDIFTTALEGGIGYWSYALNYHWQADDGTDDVMGFYADIIVPLSDLPEGDTPVTPVEVDLPLAGPTACGKLRIDRSVILKGLRLGATTAEAGNYYWQCGCGKPPLVLTDESCEDWDYDALDADAIVQYGLFGKVVFG
jgi:hypothetical protein